MVVPFIKYSFRSDKPEKFYTNTSVDWKSDCPGTRYKILDS